MSFLSDIILQFTSISIILGSCILHFFNHYKCRNCCCPKHNIQPHTDVHTSLSTRHTRRSTRTSILIYNNQSSNNCLCCQIDITCGELSSKLLCIVPRNTDLQCYPLLFLCYLVFCIFVSVFTSYLLYTDINIAPNIEIYLISLSIIWELLLNYYKYSTTIQCIKTLVNTEEDYTLYCTIFWKIVAYGAIFIVLLHLLIIIHDQYNTLLSSIIWWILLLLIVLLHCGLNSYFILSFTNILLQQYDAMIEMEPNLVDFINDSMKDTVVSMRRFSLCSITISTIYLVILLMSNDYIKSNIINIIKYYSCFWCLICFIFCLNFAKNREWIKEKLLYLWFKLKTAHKGNKHHHLRLQAEKTKDNIETHAHIDDHKVNTHINNEENDTKETEEEDIDDGESASQTLLTSSDTTRSNTTCLPKLNPPSTHLGKSQSDFLINWNLKHTEDMRRSSTDRSKRSIPFSMVIEQYKDMTERANLLQNRNNHSPSPSTGSFAIIPKKLNTSRSAIDSNSFHTKTKRFHDDSLYKSSSLTTRVNTTDIHIFNDLNDRESTESVENYNGNDDIDFKSMVASLEIKKKPNILRAQTDIDGYYGGCHKLDKNDQALNKLKQAFKPTKSGSAGDLYGMRSADHVHKTFRKNYKINRLKRSGLKALELLGISYNTEHTDSIGTESAASDHDDSSSDGGGGGGGSDGTDKKFEMLDFDTENTIVWMEESEEQCIKPQSEEFKIDMLDIDINMDSIDINVETLNTDELEDNDGDSENDEYNPKFTPLESLHMLQKNSTRLSRAVSYDLGAIDNELKREFGNTNAGMMKMMKNKSDKSVKSAKSVKSFESDDARSLSDLRNQNKLQKELHKINELNEEICAKHDMDDMVNLMYLMM